MVLAFNPARNARNTVPDSFRNFAFDTRVRGVVSMRNPLVSGTTMAAATALRDRYGYEFFEALGRQRVVIDYGTNETLTKLESGETRIAMILEESILKIRQNNDSRLEVIYPSDGTIVIPSPIMIINNRLSANRNTRTAEAIIDWFLSEIGQNVIVDGWMHSVRKDFPRIPEGSISITEIQANSLPVIWENVSQQRNDIQRRFESYVMAVR
jgi:iron(III) transport system substrate-binding protein